MSAEELIEDEADLKRAVRTSTMYLDESDLPEHVLEGQINDAKRDLRLEMNIDGGWYDDEGLTQALKSLSCILTKVAVENFTFQRYDIGNLHVEVAETEGADQIERWMRQMETGLDAMDSGNDRPNFRNTTSYIG